MIWIAPSEKDTANGTLEKRLWDTKKQKEEAEAAASQVLSSQGAELTAVKARLLAMEEAEHQRAEKEKAEDAIREDRKALHSYLWWLVLVVAIRGARSSNGGRLMPLFRIAVTEYFSKFRAPGLGTPLPACVINDRQLTVGMVRSILTRNPGRAPVSAISA